MPIREDQGRKGLSSGGWPKYEFGICLQLACYYQSIEIMLTYLQYHPTRPHHNGGVASTNLTGVHDDGHQAVFLIDIMVEGPSSTYSSALCPTYKSLSFGYTRSSLKFQEVYCIVTEGTVP